MKDWQIQHKVDDETLRQLIMLDKSTYAAKDVGSFSLCKKWLQVNSEIYTILKFRNIVVGYINFVPLKDAAFERFQKGELKDYELTENDISSFVKGKNLNCLLMSIVIKKDFRDGEAIFRLTDGFTKHLENLKARGVKIVKVLQDCISIDGIKFVINFFGADFICESHRGHKFGKIYEIDFSEPRKFYPPKLRYEELCEENLKTMAKIQYEIFKDTQSVGYSDYKKAANLKDKFANKLLPIDFLVYYQDVPVGIVGLYEIENYPDDVWVDWLGVLPEYRNQGIGTQMLLHICDVARHYKKKNIRLYSFGKTYPFGVSIYRKVMQRCEKYRNINDNIKWLEEIDCLLFSSSLIDKRPQLWKNKFIDAKSEKRIHRQSLRMLKRDNII